MRSKAPARPCLLLLLPLQPFGLRTTLKLLLGQATECCTSADLCHALKGLSALPAGCCPSLRLNPL